MGKHSLLLIFITLLAFSANRSAFPQVVKPDFGDSLARQVVYNGRVWRSLYLKVIGDQFLHTKEFMPGEVYIGGRKFSGLMLKYDIYMDEILTLTDRSIIIQINKEMVDSFSVYYPEGEHRFIRLEPDSVNSQSGYVEVLYQGNSGLYLRHRKEILYLAVDNRSDIFVESRRIYLKKEGKIETISGRNDFLAQLKDQKQSVRSFIRSRKIKMGKDTPESFVPVLEYYDSLHR